MKQIESPMNPLIADRLRTGRGCTAVWSVVTLIALIGPGGGVAPCQASRQSSEASRLFRDGSAAFAAGDLRTAETAFAKLVTLVPKVGAAHAAYGAVLLAEGKAEAALPELQEARRLDPDDLGAAVNLGVALHADGDEADAVTAFRHVTGLPGVRLQADEAIAFASALTATGDLKGAQPVLEAALAEEQDARERGRVLDTLGAVLARQSRLEEAVQRLEQAVAADPTLASAHAHLGSALLLMGSNDAALQQLRTASQMGDRSPSTTTQVARAELANGHGDEAIAAARQAVASAPADMEATYVLALALQNAGESAEALPLFRQAAVARPADAEVLSNYGLALVQTGHAKEALPVYERALTSGGSVPLLRENMGAAYLQQNDVDHAMQQFQAGLQADPDNVQLHYNLGLAYKLKDDVPAATKELQRTEALGPELPDAPYTLGVLEMQQGHFNEASVQLERVVALQPANGDAWSLLGSVYQQAHEPEKAAAALHHAIDLLPAQPSPHITLAAVLAESGDKQSAATERKIAADLSRAGVSHQREQFALESGRKLLEQGSLESALVQARPAVDAEPDSSAAHALLADVLQRSGNAQGARAEREKASMLAAKAAGATVAR